jgi:SAM-dependent methyltransferase
MPRAITEDYVLDLLDNLTLPFGDGNAGVMAYHKVFVTRYANTLKAISDLPRETKTLELAASPYGMTAALVVDFFSDMQVASFGKTGNANRVRLTVRGQDYELDEKQFNAEIDRWPYDDGTFDLILSCEMIEHMAMDPMHVFAEANRVLRPGGRLFVSTPNASSFQNGIKIMQYKTASLSPHYRTPSDLSGIYQRHNRELTPLALAAMFRCGGFTEQHYETVNNYPFSAFGAEQHVIEMLRAAFCSSWRGDTLNFIATKSGPVIERFPEDEELYIATDPR